MAKKFKEKAIVRTVKKFQDDGDDCITTSKVADALINRYPRYFTIADVGSMLSMFCKRTGSQRTGPSSVQATWHLLEKDASKKEGW